MDCDIVHQKAFVLDFFSVQKSRYTAGPRQTSDANSVGPRMEIIGGYVNVLLVVYRLIWMHRSVGRAIRYCAKWRISTPHKGMIVLLRIGMARQRRGRGNPWLSLEVGKQENGSIHLSLPSIFRTMVVLLGKHRGRM